jgi:hypothetical protein
VRVATLREQLQGASGRAFSLATDALGVPGVKALIETHLGGTLTVGAAKPDLKELTVEGSGTVDSMQNRPVKVWFSTDAAAENVTGLLIAFQADGWSINTGFFKFDGGYLQQYPTLTSLALALSARPEDRTETAFGVGVGVYVHVDSMPLLLHAAQPLLKRLKKPHAQEPDITLRGDFSGLSLGLGKLADFISGYNFTGLLPDTIPLADEFELRSATFVVNPNLKFITAVGLEVRSARPWVLVKDKFELDYLDISFTVNTPGVSTTVYWDITSEMKLGDAVKVITSIDSDLNLSVELAERVPIKPILKRYYPAADLDFTVDALRIGLAFGDEPPTWSFALGVDSLWVIFNAVAVEAIRLSASGKGTSPEDVRIDARLGLGDAELYLAGEMNKGAGWDFDGRMSHDYNVRIVPNPDFKPGDPGGTPLKPEHVAANASHFFENIFDKLFPGGAASGVPPVLDVDIKTLGVRFNTQTKDFHFDTDIEFGKGKDVEATLTFANLHQAGTQSPTFEKRATGVIKVFPGKTNEFAFKLGIDLKQDSKHFVALYHNTAGKAINLAGLVRAMFPDVSSLPVPNFDITIKDAVVGYVSNKQAEKIVSQSVFALDMGASIDLSSLGEIPLIGRSLSAAKMLKLAFQLVYPAGTAPFATADLVALNDLITVAGPKFPVDQVLSEPLVKTELRIGDGKPIDFKLPVVINPDGQLANTDKPFNPPPGAQATDDGVKWFQLNTQFGPVHLQRAGFKFDKGEVTALLDGGLAALGLEVDLMGLSVTSKITDVKDGEFHPRFGLEGLGLSFSKGGVGFAGALLHLEVTRDGQTVDEYDGLASVEAEGLRLAAIGSLTKVNGQTSLFLFAVLDYPLGGAPFFYVTGLAGGFGLNQKLVMPAVDQVRTFPLVDAALNPPKVPTDAGSAGPFITEEMKKLHTSLIPSVGQYFGCAGIRFTSFELLDSFVLVSLSFGREFELDLLGMSTLVVPPELPPSEPALAKVSLQIVASFIPNEGLAIVQGRLTADSHILDPNCHLTGGFAFATWFGANPHVGDFVITLGGYHPDFQKPGHYPTVPRVGVNWQITPQLSVTGGLYFALTPRALMAGGAMRAVFQTSIDLSIASVDVKAWFILGADFIVYWKPFHYSAHLYIDIGIDVVIHFLGTHDLGFDAGADLQVWGPAFGGHAHVFIKVIGIKIGFDVDFGAAAPKPPPLTWDYKDDASKSFRKSFLPPDDKIVSVAIGAGLVRKVDIGKEGRGGGVTATGDEQTSDVWYVINASDFCVRTSSVIPVKECVTTIRGSDKKTLLSDFAGNTNFGIASMGKGRDKVKTFHRIAVKRDGQPAEAQFVARPIHQHVPGGLWAETNSADINAELLIEKAVVGFEIVPVEASVPGHTRPIQRDCLTYTTHALENAFADHDIDTFTVTWSNPGDDPAANRALWDCIQGEIHLNTTRDAMLAAMSFADADFDIGESFSTDAAYAPSYGSLGR